MRSSTLTFSIDSKAMCMLNHLVAACGQFMAMVSLPKGMHTPHNEHATPPTPHTSGETLGMLASRPGGSIIHTWQHTCLLHSTQMAEPTQCWHRWFDATNCLVEE
eukprot:2471022-Alexandrium_andersonii.AAC.1